MIDLDRRLGPLPLRAWGLVLNLCGNAVALYGAAAVLRDGSGWTTLTVGIVVTVGCILVLAIPTPDEPTPD